MATPSVPPSSRVVSLTAEPAPALSRGSAPMIASVAGLEVSARPAAISTIDGDDPAPVARRHRRPGGDQEARSSSAAGPPVTMTLVPARFISAMATGDKAPVTIANGSVARPAFSGS